MGQGGPQMGQGGPKMGLGGPQTGRGGSQMEQNSFTIVGVTGVTRRASDGARRPSYGPRNSLECILKGTGRASRRGTVKERKKNLFTWL